MRTCRFAAAAIALIVCLGVGWPCLAEDAPLPPASGTGASDARSRWLRKRAPTAPLPALASAAAPDSTLDIFELGEELGRPPDTEKAPLPRAELPRQEMPRQKMPSVSGGEGLTLAELECIALANNPTLAQAEMRVQAAHGKCLQAGLYPNPTVGYHAEEMGNEGSAGQQGAFVSQQIVRGGKLQLRSAVAANEIAQAENALEAQRRRVLNDVRSGWLDVLVAQRIVELNDQLVRIGEQGVKAARELLSAKEVSRVDLLQAQIEADAARLQLEEARNRQQALWRRLAALLAAPEMKPVRLEGNLEESMPPLNWQAALQRLLTESPKLAAARAGAARARSMVVREQAEKVSNVDVTAGVRYDDAANDTVATVMVGLPLPIFNRNQGNIYRAESQLVAAQREVQRVELVLRQQLAAAFERYSTARQQAKKYASQILPNAQTSLDLVQAGYRQGEYDYLTLLTAQRTFYRVNLAYLQSLREYRAKSVAIEGLLLSGGLAENVKDGEDAADE